MSEVPLYALTSPSGDEPMAEEWDVQGVRRVECRDVSTQGLITYEPQGLISWNVIGRLFVSRVRGSQVGCARLSNSQPQVLQPKPQTHLQVMNRWLKSGMYKAFGAWSAETSQRRGPNFKRVEVFYHEAKARIWP